MTEIRLDVDLVYPPARVWRALTARRELAEWFLPVRTDPAGPGRLRFEPSRGDGLGGPFVAEVVEAVPPQRLSMRWYADDLHVRVNLTLEPTPAGCRLTFVQRGFLGPKGTLRRRALRAMYSRLFTERLPGWLARARELEPAGDPRRNAGGVRYAPAAVPGPATGTVRGRAAVPHQVTRTVRRRTPSPPVAHVRPFVGSFVRSVVREVGAWVRAVPGWTAERRSRAVTLGAVLLLLVALVIVLVSRLTVNTGAGPPRVGGGDGRSPGFAMAPAEVGPGGAVSPAAPVPHASAWAAAVPGGPLTGAYRTASIWLGGYRGEMRLTNPGVEPVRAWTVTLTLPLLGLVVQDVHGARSEQSGRTVTFTPVAPTGTVAGHASVSFDFAVDGVGAPTACTVDGRACTGIPG